jgi:hypothetical protein
MKKPKVLDLNMFLENCANIIADQYGFEDDSAVKKILSNCLPKSFLLNEELIANVDVNSSSLDYSTAINSIKNIFRPNFIQAVIWMNPKDALDLFLNENKSDLALSEDFFNSTYPNILSFSSSLIKTQSERLLVYLKKSKHQFIKNGFFSEVFDGSFWLPSFLTGSLEETEAWLPQRVKYFEERQKKQIDPDKAHIQWHNLNPPKYDDTFVSSLILPVDAHKKIGRFKNEAWFIGEETELREKIFSVFYKTTQIIFESELGVDLVEKYLRLIERTFTLPELELLFGKSMRYFSFPVSNLDGFDFKFGKDFVLSTVRFLAFYIAQEKRENLFSKLESKLDSTLPRESVNTNLYEAIRIAGGYDAVKKIIAGYKTVATEVDKLNSEAIYKFERLKGLVEENSQAKIQGKSTDRFIPVVKLYSKSDQRPLGPCFSENFDIFYPADSKKEPLFFTPLQAKFVEYLMREGATDKLRAVSKLQILNELYNKKYAKIILGADNEDLDSEEKKLLKEFRKYRLDQYIFKDSPAWKIGFIRSDERNFYQIAKYWLDFDYSKKKASKLRKKRKARKKKKAKST